MSMAEVMEDTEPVRRRTPAEKKRDARVERCREAVKDKHGEDAECVVSFFMGMNELYVAVFVDRKCVGNYEWLEEE